jgi:hypothetical protein
MVFKDFLTLNGSQITEFTKYGRYTVSCSRLILSSRTLILS